MGVTKRSPVRGVAALAMLLVAAVAGCSSKSDDTASQAKTPDKVVYITGFGSFGRDAYIWVAKQKGYFKAANIDVQIEPGNGSNNERELAAGKAQFSAIDLSAAILQISKAPSPLGIRAIAAIQQNSMSAIMALPGSGIARPQDLAGKTIAVTPGGVEELLFPNYAKLAGFDGSKVKFVSSSAAQLPQMLATSQVNAISQFVVGQPTVQAVVKSKSLTVLPYSDYIKDLYGNALFTTTSLIKSNPDLVKRFRDALLKGLNDSLADPDGAGKILQQNVPTANATSAAAELSLMKQYVQGTAGATVGGLTPDRVGQMVDTLHDAGAIQKTVDADTIVDFDLVPKQG
ncbi:ABC transporter substrate-binding protein [Rugosimonospora acidiphila]|uniref:Thiamine pyrimidine synthase n=1 Tax=Rugosimonospora acidiphila TaxID=556531 RepID=A0ABP9RU12_9ACTN